MEQIAPFPYKEFLEIVKLYENAEIYWVQEEHMNQGCWTYVEPRMKSLLNHVGMDKKEKIKYIGRKSSAVTSTAYEDIHLLQLEELVSDAFA